MPVAFPTGFFRVEITTFRELEMEVVSNMEAAGINGGVAWKECGYLAPPLLQLPELALAMYLACLASGGPP
jgi:hypothetical protein